MIKPEEIHKGNLLMWEDDSKEIIKVTGFYEDEVVGDVVKFKGGGAQLDEFVGITLTEEILIKAGFENWGNAYVNEYEFYHRYVLHNEIEGSSNFEVHLIHSRYGGMEETEIAYAIDSDRQYIHCTDYLHNLQNAFYQTSGTELNIQI